VNVFFRALKDRAVVELPGIEPGAKIALTCGKLEFDDTKRRQITRNDPSWIDRLCFTFTACPDTIPHPQRLSVYLADELDETEKALGI
jgi:hypothetical protein